MKVFISWSGRPSAKVASCIRNWLPSVIQAVDPWLSIDDIKKGAKWSSELANELNSTSAGIICVTPDSLKSSWLLFEAGAISKVLDNSVVIPYLFKTSPTNVEGPLAQFQSAVADKDGTLGMIKSLNSRLEKPIAEQSLEETFDLWWPQLESELDKVEINNSNSTEQNSRSDRELLEEVLEKMRHIERELVPGFKTVSNPVLEESLVLKAAFDQIMRRKKAARDHENDWDAIEDLYNQFNPNSGNTEK